MKRIRYRKTDKDGELVSVRFFANERGRLYQVKLNLQEMTFRIIDQKEKRVVASSIKNKCRIPSTREILHRQVKRALKKLGVNFEHEFRKLGE